MWRRLFRFFSTLLRRETEKIGGLQKFKMTKMTEMAAHRGVTGEGAA